jgi:hypothetical protein
MLYAFEIVKPDGEIVQYFDVDLPVAERDTLTLRREAFPQTLSTGLAANPAEFEPLKCLRRAEDRMGSGREFHHRLQLDPANPQSPRKLAETYKQAWGNSSNF